MLELWWWPSLSGLAAGWLAISGPTDYLINAFSENVLLVLGAFCAFWIPAFIAVTMRCTMIQKKLCKIGYRVNIDIIWIQRCRAILMIVPFILIGLITYYIKHDSIKPLAHITSFILFFWSFGNILFLSFEQIFILLKYESKLLEIKSEELIYYDRPILRISYTKKEVMLGSFIFFLLIIWTLNLVVNIVHAYTLPANGEGLDSSVYENMKAADNLFRIQEKKSYGGECAVTNFDEALAFCLPGQVMVYTERNQAGGDSEEAQRVSRGFCKSGTTEDQAVRTLN